MIKMNRQEQAIYYKHHGCNCAQAVLLAYRDVLNLSEEQLKQLGAGFGGGMGCMQATCGALCGAQMVLGLLNYQGRPIMGKANTLYSEFEKMCGASLCKDLKGIETKQVLCSCDDCIKNAITILENM